MATPLPQQQFTLTEISGAVSRTLNLSPDLPAVGAMAARLEYIINQTPEFQQAGLQGDGIRALVMSSVTSDVMQLLDPATREAAMKAQMERANVTGSEGAAFARALGLDPASWAAAGERIAASSQRFADMALSSLDLSKITPDNYSSSGAMFRNAGLNFGTFADLRGQGFNAQQILSAASFTREMGLDVNRGAPVVARLQRDMGDANYAMRDMRDNERGLVEAKRNLAEAEARGASAEELAKLRQKVEDWKKYGDSYHKGYRDKAAPKGRAGDVDEYKRQVEEANRHLSPATAHMSPKQAAEFKKAYDETIREPNDPAARERWQAMVKQYGGTPEAKRELVAAERAREKMVTTTVVKRTNTAETQEAKAKVDTTNADLLASINGGPTTPSEPQPPIAPRAPSPAPT